MKLVKVKELVGFFASITSNQIGTWDCTFSITCILLGHPLTLSMLGLLSSKALGWQDF